MCGFSGRINVTLFKLPYEIGGIWQVLTKIGPFPQDIEMKIDSAPEALQNVRQSGKSLEATCKKRRDWSIDLTGESVTLCCNCLTYMYIHVR